MERRFVHTIGRAGWVLSVASLFAATGCGRSARSSVESPSSNAGDGGSGESGSGGSASGGTSGGTAGESAGRGGRAPAGGSDSGGSNSGGSNSGGSPGGGGASGDGGAVGGGAAGGDTAGTAGAANVEYRACANDTQAIPRVNVYRADLTNGTCTVLMLEADGAASCAMLSSGAWCLYQAHRGSDVEACRRSAFPMPSSAATSATGSFTVANAAVEIAISLEFADSPDRVEFNVSECSTACSMTDCR